MAGLAEGRAQRRGGYVIAILAVATLLEYVVALSIDNTALLVVGLSVFAVVKAAVIIDEFMHARRLVRSDRTATAEEPAP